MSDDELMPPPMFDLDEAIRREHRLRGFDAGVLVNENEPLKSIKPIPGHQVKGFLWTTRNKFKGIVWLDYSALNVHNCPSAKQAAQHAFSRAVMNSTLGADAKDLAGHILFVPETPWGGPVMVKQ